MKARSLAGWARPWPAIPVPLVETVLSALCPCFSHSQGCPGPENKRNRLAIACGTAIVKVRNSLAVSPLPALAARGSPGSGSFLGVTGSVCVSSRLAFPAQFGAVSVGVPAPWVVHRLIRVESTHPPSELLHSRQEIF